MTTSEEIPTALDEVRNALALARVERSSAEAAENLSVALAAALLERATCSEEQRVLLFGELHDALFENGEPTTLLAHISWETARLLAPYLPDPCLPPTASETLAEDLLADIARHGHARDIANFAPERLAEIAREADGDGRLIAEFAGLVGALGIATTRIKAKSRGSFVENAVGVALRGRTIFRSLEKSPRPDSSSARDYLLNVYLDFTESMRACIDTDEETDSIRIRHAVTCLAAHMCADCLAHLPVAFASDEGPGKRAILRLFAILKASGISVLNIAESISKASPIEVSLYGTAVLIALVYQVEEESASVEMPGLLPRVVSARWLFEKTGGMLASLCDRCHKLTDLSSLPCSAEKLDINATEKAIAMLSFFTNRLERNQFSFASLDFKMLGDTYSLNDLNEVRSDVIFPIALVTFHAYMTDPPPFMLQIILRFLSATPHQIPRSRAFVLFKRYLHIFDDEARARIIADLLSSPGAPSIKVAAMSILKDFVHEAFNEAQVSSNTTSSPAPPLFAGPYLTETLLAILLNPDEPMYRSSLIPTRTILNDDQTFFELLGNVLHVLNLYRYLLMRDSPKENKVGYAEEFRDLQTLSFSRGFKLGLWDPSHIDRTRKRYLNPLRSRVDELLQAVSEELEQIEAAGDAHLLGECYSGHVHGEINVSHSNPADVEDQDAGGEDAEEVEEEEGDEIEDEDAAQTRAKEIQFSPSSLHLNPLFLSGHGTKTLQMNASSLYLVDTVMGYIDERIQVGSELMENILDDA
ncbi:hypothetical protein BDK51DRAFT_37806 [Blyttiomyces helicus]|uniref:YAP-binding/ALF4/Glomulin n=1 Tax=Blyttiomyces helicus TaxID=388810 RepID=A0A4P9WDV6_9FUNG|nr:hypothetical protein BDK51DRAFT_37806 [Blyttiomyces helicus]|eukprot:RKO89418.1 hypothetical protein BDK51DRAFT_37806 [Blyttiomyces helicus]